MIDIHTHILPNVDDGAEDINQAIELLNQAIEQGITHVILTPHIILNSSRFPGVETIKQRFLEFQEQVKDLDIKIYLGSEIFYSSKAYQRLVNDELITFNNSKYCLIEFTMKKKQDIDEALYNIRAKGYYPILAHPERYEYIKLEDVVKIKEHSKIQVNTSSILGLHGRKIRRFAFKMMKNNLVDYVASDSHNPTTRYINLLEAYKIVSKKFGKAHADNVFTVNQEKLISKIIDKESQ